MENVQSNARPLAYFLARKIERNDESNQRLSLEGNTTFKFTGSPDTSADVIYDF
jgi:hypothetical protein